jgi:hypothetical protein
VEQNNQVQPIQPEEVITKLEQKTPEKSHRLKFLKLKYFILLIIVLFLFVIFFHKSTLNQQYQPSSKTPPPGYVANASPTPVQLPTLGEVKKIDVSDNLIPLEKAKAYAEQFCKQVYGAKSVVVQARGNINDETFTGWLGASGKFYFVHGYSCYESSTGISKHGFFEDTSLELQNKKKSIEFLSLNDFTQVKNSHNQADYEGEYEKEEIDCKLGDMRKGIALACYVYNEDLNKLSAEFQPIINPTNDPNIFILVENIVGNNAIGRSGNIILSSNEKRSQQNVWHDWYAKKINGTWTKISLPGYDMSHLTCDYAKQYQIPGELTGHQCFDPKQDEWVENTIPLN